MKHKRQVYMLTLRRRRNIGQALIEYILLVCIIALSTFAMVRLFSRFFQLIFQDHVRSLGYELPLDKDIATAEKKAVKVLMEVEVLKKQFQ